ncbi:MAG: ribosome assembly RNA-binding protein YhbY [Xanthomonadales bacterium]|nr:ribosome assembly RNA-binding protein YhbY [Xanthomonadales bacterium]
MLSKTQKKYLAGICHHLKPVVWLGQKGLTDAVLAEIDQALTAHELVKIKLAGADREERQAWAGEIAERLQAEPVKLIGGMASFFRRNPDRPQLELPD